MTLYSRHEMSSQTQPGGAANDATRAVVARISAGPVDFEHRIFGCAICNYAEEVVLAVDPRRAGAIGWLATTTINRR